MRMRTRTCLCQHPRPCGRPHPCRWQRPPLPPCRRLEGVVSPLPLLGLPLHPLAPSHWALPQRGVHRRRPHPGPTQHLTVVVVVVWPLWASPWRPPLHHAHLHLGLWTPGSLRG